MFSRLIVVTTLLLSSVAFAADSGTVLITGANRGIGLELARQFAADGWQVIGTARRPDAATELADLDVDVMQLDVTDAASIAQLAQSLANRPIDVLINNAGIFPRMSALAEVDFDDYTQLLAVNTIGPARVTQALLPNLRAGNQKQVLNMSSGLGSIAGNSGGYYGYRESKAALNMFTVTLARELADDGFTCIVMNPGWVRTDMGGANATTSVEDSAAGIRRVLAGLSPADSGTFWTFQGDQTDW